MKHTIVTYLHSMGEFEMAEEVISMHNRLEAFAGRLDKAALDAAISAAEEAIRQRDELLAALEKFMDSHEECADFDGFTAQIVSVDDYHEAQEAIERAKGGA